ncbi:BMP family protein [Clostridia bacterium]|nr:BMP family protein [Clostridia bacterium]
MKKKLSVLLVLMLVFALFTGCTSTEEPAAEPSEEPAEEAMPMKVAALMPGPINDMGWNATAYNGLLAIEEQFGADISYVENVSSSDMEEVFRNFALQDYDIVFGHGFEFGDPALRVAEEFPDTTFIIVSSDITNGSNLSSVNFAAPQQGFIAGALAALITESDVVAGIGGLDIPPIRMPILGFMAGAEYVNPDIDVRTVMTGSMDDVAGLKETAYAMLDEDADVIFALADQAGMGAIEATTERGKWSIGANVDQNERSPQAVVQSVIKDSPILFTYMAEMIANGTYEAGAYELGVAENAISLADWHGYDEEFPEAKAEIEKIIEGLKSGEISIDISGYDL